MKSVRRRRVYATHLEVVSLYKRFRSVKLDKKYLIIFLGLNAKLTSGLSIVVRLLQDYLEKTFL